MQRTVGTFPSTYAEVATETLLDAYSAGPRRLRRAVHDLSEEVLRARPIPGKWSILEIAIHVADSELMGAARIRMVLGAGEPILPAYDQDRWSQVFGYGDVPLERLEVALTLFGELRTSTLPLFPAHSSLDWTRTGVHHEHGMVTLRNLLELYADHSERHLEQIVDRRERLGNPIEFAPLLPGRLY